MVWVAKHFVIKNKNKLRYIYIYNIYFYLRLYNLIKSMNPYIHNDMSMSLNNMNQLNQLNQFQSILQLHIMRNFTTGNWIFDTIIQSLLVMIIGFVVTRIKNLFDTFGRLMSYFFDNIFQYMKNIYRYLRGYKLKIKKTVEIPYITSTKQINELYKAVNWYLTNNKEIDLTDTNYLEYSFDKKIITDNFKSIKSNTDISKIPISSQFNSPQSNIVIVDVDIL